MTDNERPPKSETDWLANSPYGFGYGYTKAQALREMAEFVRCDDGEEFTVDLFEHTGNVEMSMGSVRFKGEMVAHERLTIEADDEWNRFRAATITAKGNGEHYAEQSEAVDDDNV